MFEFSNQVLFLLSAIGAVNGMLLAAFISFNNRGNYSYYFLSALLVFVSIRVAKSVLFYFSPELDKTILQIGLSACFLIGPMTYFYTLITVNNLTEISHSHKVHLVGLGFVTVMFGLSYPYTTNPELWGNYVYKVVNYVWLGYLLMAWFEIYKRFYNKQPLFHSNHILLLGVNIGGSIIWLAYFTASFTSYILGALSFSFIVYITIAFFLSFKSSKKAESYLSKKFDIQKVTTLCQRLNDTMVQDQYFCDPLITLPKLAQKMGVSTAQLSQLLNDNLAKSFTTYLNEMRIEKAKTLLVGESNITMESVAELCGYNSMSTFYSAFKKIVGTTPAKYRNENNG